MAAQRTFLLQVNSSLFAAHLMRFFLSSRHLVNRGGYGNLTASEVPYSKGGVSPHGANHPPRDSFSPRRDRRPMAQRRAAYIRGGYKRMDAFARRLASPSWRAQWPGPYPCESFSWSHNRHRHHHHHHYRYSQQEETTGRDIRSPSRGPVLVLGVSPRAISQPYDRRPRNSQQHRRFDDKARDAGVVRDITCDFRSSFFVGTDGNRSV